MKTRARARAHASASTPAGNRRAVPHGRPIGPDRPRARPPLAVQSEARLRPGRASSVSLAVASHRPALSTSPPLTSRNQSRPPWPTQLGQTMLIRRGGVMCTSGPRPQNPCPLGLQCDRRIESSESGWTRRRSMRTLSVVRNAMDHLQMEPLSSDTSWRGPSYL